METILHGGIAFIVAFQSLGSWLILPMKFFTFLGSEEFFLIILPVIYWCVNPHLGMRMGTLMLISGGLNDVLKLAFYTPRPYWYDPHVKALAFERSFGVPSGHAQKALAIWGPLAAHVKRPWAWATVSIIILMIGLSRIYLGVHFPHDVILGWLIGGLVLWIFLRYEGPVEGWLKKQSVGLQIGLAFALSMLIVAAASLAVLSLRGWVFPTDWANNIAKAGSTELPEPFALSDMLSGAGALFGLLGGFAWFRSRGGFSADGPLWQRVGRYLLALAGVLVLWVGLGAVLPRGEEIVPYILRYLRYALVGAWVSAGAPYLFVRFNLAKKANT
jgi:membrane-associated phospholipid phosphatase